MDGLVGLLADAVAKRVREARADAVRREFQARGDRSSDAVPPGATVRRPMPPPGTPARRRAPAPAGSVPPASAPADALALAPPPARAMPSAPAADLDSPAMRAPLLAAFRSGGLLGALVLSEALAPPLALRDNPFRPGGVEGG